MEIMPSEISLAPDWTIYPNGVSRADFMVGQVRVELWVMDLSPQQPHPGIEQSRPWAASVWPPRPPLEWTSLDARGSAPDDTQGRLDATRAAEGLLALLHPRLLEAAP